MSDNISLQVVTGSLQDIVQSKHTSLADAFVDVDAVILIDESGSMAATDSRGGKSRFSVACEELANLQKSQPGKFAVIGFSTEVVPHIGGVPIYQSGGTDMARALNYAKMFDVPTMQIFMVSDGEPNSEEQTIEVAKTYKHANILTIFVGPETDRGGRDFLAKLAAVRGGKTTTADRVMELSEKVQTLMLEGVRA